MNELTDEQREVVERIRAKRPRRPPLLPDDLKGAPAAKWAKEHGANLHAAAKHHGVSRNDVEHAWRRLFGDEPYVKAAKMTGNGLCFDAARVRRSAKLDREEARRVRAGAIGLLECCRCDYPLQQHATESMHDAECPAHEMTLSAMRVGRHFHLTWTPSAKGT